MSKEAFEEAVPKSAVVARSGKTKGGTLLIIGGAEERTIEGPILQTFVDLAGGSSAHIVIIPTASEKPDTGQDYERIFTELGVASAEILEVQERHEANDRVACEGLSKATGIFMTGGNQSRLSRILAGTIVMDCIREQYQKGAVIAGTSAGASIMGSHMMSGGTGTEAPRKGMTDMVAGFGLLQDIIIDQHFNQRGRIGRLLVLFSANPGLVAMGIDEDTAAIVTEDGIVECIGTSSILLLDGRDVVSNFYDIDEGEVVTITGSSLHVLGPGKHFDLNIRTVLDVTGSANGKD